MNTAIVTGASSGLGREFFRAIVAYYPELDDIWIIARRKDRLEALAAETTGRKVRVLPLDLTNEDDIAAYAALLKQEKPPVRLLINNAGAGTIGNVWELDYLRQGQSVSLNCRSMVEVSALTVPYMTAGSSIINTCSIAAFVPTPRMTTYSATKAFVYAFSKGLRFELKSKKINCLAVCPCPMETEFLEAGNIPGRSKTLRQSAALQSDKGSEDLAEKSLCRQGDLHSKGILQILPFHCKGTAARLCHAHEQTLRCRI